MRYEKLLRKIFKLYDVIHPNSRTRVRWILPPAVREQLVAMARQQRQRSSFGPFAFHGPDHTDPDAHDRLLDMAVRVDASAPTIMFEVYR